MAISFLNKHKRVITFSWAALICIYFVWQLPYVKYRADKIIRFSESSYENNLVVTIQDSPHQAWSQILTLGEISRHHRLAHLKTEVWYLLVNFPHDQLINEIQSVEDWTLKNKDNFDIQFSWYYFNIRANQFDKGKSLLINNLFRLATIETLKSHVINNARKPHLQVMLSQIAELETNSKAVMTFSEYYRI